MSAATSEGCSYCGGSGKIVSPFDHERYPCPECQRPAELLVRGHGEGQASALRELGIDVSEIDWAREVIAAARSKRDTPYAAPVADARDDNEEIDLTPALNKLDIFLAFGTKVTDLVSEARALDAKATPGPWLIEREECLYPEDLELPEDEQPVGFPETIGPITHWEHAASGDGSEERCEADAAFIARARTLLPALSDALERAERENARLRGIAENAERTNEGLCAEIDALTDAHAREREGMLGDKKHLNDEWLAAGERILYLEQFIATFNPLLRAYHAGADRNQLKAACIERWGPSTSVSASNLRGLAEREGNR